MHGSGDMEAYQSDPLVSPIRRRGWREIVRFAPLTAQPHIALVVSRRGRVISIIPANTRRTLSDYLDWPFEYREVDLRERLLELNLRLDSCDVGYAFTAVLRLVYQVVRPERIAVEHADVLHEFEAAIVQRARAIAQKLGIEQSGLLKEYLLEALMSGNELPQRFDQLGLALRRADVAIELDHHAREFAETVYEQFRDRPLILSLVLESSQPGATFTVRVGGFYRLRSRDGELHTPATAEPIIHAAVHRSLHRVAARFAPHQERDAITAMTDELWHDTVLKATLAASNLELLRPAVQILAHPPALDAPALRPMLSDSQTIGARQAADARGPVQHDDIGADQPLPSAHHTASISPIWEDERTNVEETGNETSAWRMVAPETCAPACDADPRNDNQHVPTHVSPMHDDEDGRDDPPEWVAWRAALDQAQTADGDVSLPWAAPPLWSGEASRLEIVARWVELLSTQEAWAFQYTARTIAERPETIETIICGLTDDPTLCYHAADPRCRLLLAETLKSILEMNEENLFIAGQSSERHLSHSREESGSRTVDESNTPLSS
jgi:hypothetical protein